MHPHTVVLLADRWCMLKEIQAYPAQTAPVGLARQQRAIGVLMQKLALFRPCNIHLEGSKDTQFCLHLEDTNILSFTVWPTSLLGKQQGLVWWDSREMRWIKHLMTQSFVKTRLRHARGSVRLYCEAKCERQHANMIPVTRLTCWCYAGIIFTMIIHGCIIRSGYLTIKWRLSIAMSIVHLAHTPKKFLASGFTSTLCGLLIMSSSVSPAGPACEFPLRP